MFNREEAIKELCQTKGLFVCGESLCNMRDEDIEVILGFVRRAKARDEEGRSHKTMNEWDQFLNTILDKKQKELLRHALDLKMPVHFYGTGLGKSTIANALKKIGHNVTEPADIDGGELGPLGVPDQGGVVCFNVSKAVLPDEETNLAVVPTTELIKELETREGIEKIIVGGSYSSYELKKHYGRTPSERNISGTLLLIKKLG